MREIENIDQYAELIDEAKQARVDIIVNGKKTDRRRNLVEDMEDVFDNRVRVMVKAEPKRLIVQIG